MAWMRPIISLSASVFHLSSFVECARWTLETFYLFVCSFFVFCGFLNVPWKIIQKPLAHIRYGMAICVDRWAVCLKDEMCVSLVYDDRMLVGSLFSVQSRATTRPETNGVCALVCVCELKGVILTSAARFMSGNKQDLLLNFIIAPVCEFEEVCKNFGNNHKNHIEWLEMIFCTFLWTDHSCTKATETAMNDDFFKKKIIFIRNCWIRVKFKPAKDWSSDF